MNTEDFTEPTHIHAYTYTCINGGTHARMTHIYILYKII